MKYRNSETRESGEGKNRERGKERKKKEQRTRMERGEKSEHETFPSRTWKLDVTGLNSVSRPRVKKRNCIKLRCLSLTRSTTRSLWRTFFFRASRCWLFRETFSIIPCVAGCVRAFFFSSSRGIGAGRRIKIHAALWSSSRDSPRWKNSANIPPHVSSRVLPLSPRDLRESSGINRFCSNRTRIDVASTQRSFKRFCNSFRSTCTARSNERIFLAKENSKDWT